MNKKIEIFVACHKPSELPDNLLFRPIHVGAAVSKITLPGLQRDDEGENISAKNPQYCEMTAQYWAWKHSAADYIGLCHYRRYLSFSSERFTNLTPDNRKQVLVKVLNPETEKKYGLLDQTAMQDLIESYDILVGEAQDLSEVYTPFGTQSTTLKHWQAHDMALINVEDLEKLFSIVEKNYPEFYKSMREYLDDKFFYGFNTFVMRKDLFCEMCEMEFSVLSQLEKQVDLRHYNQQLSRIYGFMGEILFSSFIYHLRKTRSRIKIGERQLLYFEMTDTEKRPLPQQEDSVKVILDLGGEEGYLVYPALKTLLHKCDRNRSYEIVILSENMQPLFKKGLEQQLIDYPQVTMQFFDTEQAFASMEELYNIKLHNPAIYLPWLLPDFHRCVYLRWNVLIHEDIADLYDMDLEDYAVAAALDIFWLGRINTFYREDYDFCQNTLNFRDIYSYMNDEVLLMDLDRIRSFGLVDLLAKVAPLEKLEKRPVIGIELFNVLWQEKAKILPQSWNWLVNSGWKQNFYINEAPLCVVKEYRAMKDEAKIIHYEPKKAPWHHWDNLEFFMEYWSIVEESPFKYVFRENLILKAEAENTLTKKAWRQIERILPKHSKRREFVKGLFPRNGKIYQSLLKFIGRK